MKAKLIDLSNGAKYRVNDVREVVTITVSWGTQMVHYNNGIVAGSLPISDFVHGVWHGSIDYVEPVEVKPLTNEGVLRVSPPRFKVGDPVYCPLQTKELCKVFSNDQELQPQCPLTITEVRSRHSRVSGAIVACVDEYGYSEEYDNAPFIFHATPENYELLCKLYPHIEFERPVGDKNDLASINSYGPDVSFVAVDEAADLESAECVEKTQAESPQATDILQEAKQTIAQRGVMYDSTGQKQERSMSKVVAMFNAMTGHELTVGQGWKFMCLLKLARSEQGEFNIDSFIDLAAYAALAGEEEWTKNNS